MTDEVLRGRLVLDDEVVPGRLVLEDGWIRAVEPDPADAGGGRRPDLRAGLHRRPRPRLGRPRRAR